MGLMIAGLIAALIALTLAEIGPAAVEGRAARYLEGMLYAGAGMCALGAILFTIRVMLARRRA